MEDALYKDSYFGITPPTFIPHLKPFDLDQALPRRLRPKAREVLASLRQERDLGFRVLELRV